MFRNQKKDKLKPNEVDFFVKVLVESDILPKLSHIQKLDFWDVENSKYFLSKSGTPTWDEMMNDQAVIEKYQKFVQQGFNIPKTKEECERLLNELDVVFCQSSSGVLFGCSNFKRL